jgi:osmotically-inducible protein OsmY
MRVLVVVGALVVSAVGCGHAQSSVASRSSGEQGHDEFTAAFAQVSAGAEPQATAGKYTLVDRGDGIVKVTDQSKPALERSRPDRVADVWIEKDVTAKLAADPSVDQARLDIDSSGGTVRLFGVVDDPLAAERAIKLTLDSEGVRAVEAELQFRPLEARAR